MKKNILMAILLCLGVSNYSWSRALCRCESEFYIIVGETLTLGTNVYHYTTAGNNCSGPSYNFGTVETWYNGVLISYNVMSTGFSAPCATPSV